MTEIHKITNLDYKKPTFPIKFLQGLHRQKECQGYIKITNCKSFLNFQKYHKAYFQTNHSELYIF